MSSFQTDERGHVRRQWVEQAIALAMQNRWVDAARINQSILDVYPVDTDTLNRLGRALTELGRYKEAIEDLSRSSPGVWALANRALAKEALGDRAGAAADYEAIPKKVRDHVGGSLETALTLARGWRREEYGQAIWMAAA